jgi:hypothetical protein
VAFVTWSAVLRIPAAATAPVRLKRCHRPDCGLKQFTVL